MSTGSENLFAQLSAFSSQSSRRSWFQHLQSRHERTWNVVRTLGIEPRHNLSDSITYMRSEALQWISQLRPNSIHAVVTDHPFGLSNYEKKNHSKLPGA